MKTIPRFLAVIATALSLASTVLAQLTPSLNPIPAPTPATPAQPAQAVVRQPAVAAAVAVSAPKELPQWHGPNGGDPDFGTEVIRSAKQWETFWQRVDKAVPHKLDEATEMAVVVFAGERPTGGFIVKITDSFVEKETLVVVYEVQAPGRETFVTQALTHPWGTAILPRSDRPMVFRQAAKKPAGN